MALYKETESRVGRPQKEGPGRQKRGLVLDCKACSRELVSKDLDRVLGTMGCKLLRLVPIETTDTNKKEEIQIKKKTKTQNMSQTTRYPMEIKQSALNK